MEDPKLTKKIVKREVIRVLSPGTAMDAALGQEQNNFLAAYFEAGLEKHPSGAKAQGFQGGLVGTAEAVPFQSGKDLTSMEQASHPTLTAKGAVRMGHPPSSSSGDKMYGLKPVPFKTAVALLDVSTGEFRTAEFAGPAARAQAVDAILMAGASEVLLATSAEIPAGLERVAARTRVEDWVWTRDFAAPLVERQLKVKSLEGFGLTGHAGAAIAAGAVLHYVRTTQKNEALHIDSLKFQEHSDALELDQVTVRNLELVEPLFAGQDDRATLFHTLDGCLTPMGKRLLRGTILRPLVNRDAIEARYEAVAEAAGDLMRREEIRRAFSGILDLERLLARLSLDSAGPRDVRALASSLARLPGLRAALDAMRAPQWREVAARMDTLVDVTARVATTLVAEPPLTMVDGGAIAAGVDAELDELRTISTTGRQQIAAIEERERQRTGIGSLKVRFNRCSGITSRLRRRTWGWRRRTTSASRRW